MTYHFELDFVGDWILASGVKCAVAVIVRWRDGEPAVVPLPRSGPEEPWSRCRLSADAREFLCVRHGDQERALHRYALPAN